MKNNLEYGVATVDDLPRIVEIKLAMFHEAGHTNLLSSNARNLILKDYRQLYAREEAKHFVARSNGYIVASVGAFKKSDLPFRYYQKGIYGFIGDVYTTQSFRGLGIATRLNKEALKWLKSKGIEMIRLLASETGRSVYERLGFVPSDEMVLKIEPGNIS